MIFNPFYNFYYDNIKFVSFVQLYDMKKERSEKKDINDCKIMKSYMENKSIKLYFFLFCQKAYYFNIKIQNRFKLYFTHILKFTGLYTPIRILYHKLK